MDNILNVNNFNEFFNTPKIKQKIDIKLDTKRAILPSKSP